MPTNNLIIICFLFVTSISFAQNKNKEQSDIPIYKLSSEEVIHFHNNKKQKEFDYINGKEYKTYHNSGHSNPFYNSRTGIGTVYIGGYGYPDLILNFDIYKDELINIAKQLITKQHFINLNKMLVDSFTISHDDNVIKLHNIRFFNTENNSLKDGYYEVWNFNDITFYFKHRALLIVKEGYDEFLYAPLKFIRIKDKFYGIKSKHKFLNLFPENKKEIKKYIYSLPIGFRKLNKDQIIRMLQFIETLQ